MRNYIFLLTIAIALLILASCSEPYTIDVEGRWSTGTITFEITSIDHEEGSYYELTYLYGDVGTYLFERDGIRFKFFELSSAQESYVRTYLGDMDIMFRMEYHIRTDTIRLMYLNFINEPVVFNRIVKQ